MNGTVEPVVTRQDPSRRRRDPTPSTHRQNPVTDPPRLHLPVDSVKDDIWDHYGPPSTKRKVPYYTDPRRHIPSGRGKGQNGREDRSPLSTIQYRGRPSLLPDLHPTPGPDPPFCPPVAPPLPFREEGRTRRTAPRQPLPTLVRRSDPKDLDTRRLRRHVQPAPRGTSRLTFLPGPESSTSTGTPLRSGKRLGDFETKKARLPCRPRGRTTLDPREKG